jgi:uncharacterized protein (TIGR02266 family)
MADTRKDKRAPLSLKVRFKSATLDEFIEQYSLDISRGGIFIKSKNPMAVGTLLKFEFQLKDASRLIHGVGRVVWRREKDHPSGHSPGMGIKFIKMDPDSRAVVERMVARRGDAPGHFEEGESGNAASGTPFFPDTTPQSELPAPEDRTQVRHASEFLASALQGTSAASAEAERKAEEARRRSAEIEQARATARKRRRPRIKKTLVGVGIPTEDEESAAAPPGLPGVGAASGAEAAAPDLGGLGFGAPELGQPAAATPAIPEMDLPDAAPSGFGATEPAGPVLGDEVSESAETQAVDRDGLEGLEGLRAPSMPEAEPSSAPEPMPDEALAAPSAPSTVAVARPVDPPRPPEPATATPAAAASAAQPKAKGGGSSFLYLLAGLLLLGIIGGVVYFAVFAPGQPSTAPAPSAPDPFEETPAVVEDTPAEAPADGAEPAPDATGAMVQVEVTSTPAGATVTLGGVAQEGVTPLTVELPAGEEAELAFALAGHQPATQTYTATGEEGQSVAVELAPLPYRLRVTTTGTASYRFLISGHRAQAAPGTFEFPEPPTRAVNITVQANGRAPGRATVQLDDFQLNEAGDAMEARLVLSPASAGPRRRSGGADTPAPEETTSGAPAPSRSRSRSRSRADRQPRHREPLLRPLQGSSGNPGMRGVRRTQPSRRAPRLVAQDPVGEALRLAEGGVVSPLRPSDGVADEGPPPGGEVERHRRAGVDPLGGMDGAALGETLEPEARPVPPGPQERDLGTLGRSDGHLEQVRLRGYESRRDAAPGAKRGGGSGPTRRSRSRGRGRTEGCAATPSTSRGGSPEAPRTRRAGRPPPGPGWRRRRPRASGWT